MKLLFKQRFFSWFDSFDIYNEAGEVVYVVKGQMSWGKCLKIFSADGYEIGTVKERIISWLPKYEMYFGDSYVGCISKEFSFFTPKFNIDCNGWKVGGNYFEWDYTISDEIGREIATVSKEFAWTDTYSISVNDPKDAIYALMLVLAIDAEKARRN